MCMRRILFLLAATILGCQTCEVQVPPRVEQQVAAVASARVQPDLSTGIATPLCPVVDRPAAKLTSVDLPSFWNLALAHNPSLREAAADVEAALGRRLQAAKYPNPHVAYSQENVGTRPEPAGAVKIELTQEILTGHKRSLDVAIAAEGLDEASLALLGRKFEVLTRIRRAYYEYLGGLESVRVNAETVARLEQGYEITRKQVEEAKTRPRTDLLRIDAMLEEARTRLAGSRLSLDAAWKQLTSEVGVPELSFPATPVDFQSCSSVGPRRN